MNKEQYFDLQALLYALKSGKGMSKKEKSIFVKGFHETVIIKSLFKNGTISINDKDIEKKFNETFDINS